MGSQSRGIGEEWDADTTVLVRDLFDSLDAVALRRDQLTAQFFMRKVEQYGSNVMQARDCRPGREGETLLHSAARCGDRSVTRFLIEVGAGSVDLDASSSPITLITPFMTAIVNHNFDVAMDFLAAGAHWDVVDFAGDNILHYLARAGSAKALKQIVNICGLSGRAVQQLASQANGQGKKSKFPEDVAVNPLVKAILRSYRETGIYNPPERERDRLKRRGPRGSSPSHSNRK
jgi:ankyrin repeat protein